MEQKTNINMSSIGISSILTVIFVIAKILGYISWSWWLVFLPTLIGVGFALLVLVITLIIVCIANR